MKETPLPPGPPMNMINPCLATRSLDARTGIGEKSSKTRLFRCLDPCQGEGRISYFRVSVVEWYLANSEAKQRRCLICVIRQVYKVNYLVEAALCLQSIGAWFPIYTRMTLCSLQGATFSTLIKSME
jgi:hypothetical protein